MKKNDFSKTTYVVRHVSDLYVGEKADQPNHWILYSLPENAIQFQSRNDAEDFISARANWLQPYLSVEKF